MRFVATTATTIRTMAPTRSAQGARLKNSHHTTIANPQASPPSIANMRASGATRGTTNQSSHCSTTATTPGHSRSGFRGGSSSVCAMAISETNTLLNQPFVPWFLGGTLLLTQDAKQDDRRNSGAQAFTSVQSPN